MKSSSLPQLIVVYCLVASFAVFLCGCGGGRRAPAKSGAAQYLNKAKEYESQALSHKEKGEDKEAIIMFKEALNKIDTGLKNALPNERPSLRTVKERIEPRITELEMREKARQQREAAAKKEAAEKKKMADLGKTDTSKDEDLKRKAEEEKKKKEAEARKALITLQQEQSSVKAANKVAGGDDDDEDPDAVAKLADAAKKEEKPKPPEGPFRTYPEGQKPPRLSVDKVEVRGEFLYAYIQIFNENDANMRIARPDVTFTTFKDADLCPADACFYYKAFDKTATNPLEQSNKRAFITGSSHEVFGKSNFKMLAISQNKEKASRTRKAQVTIMFDDGNTWTVRGPMDARAPVVEGLPGL